MEEQEEDNQHDYRVPVTALAGTVVVLVVATFVLILTVARIGGSELDDAAGQIGDYALRQGQQFERSGNLPEAIKAYRGALNLGIDIPASRADCQQRLSSLLALQGRIAGYRPRVAANILTGSGFNAPSECASWSPGDSLGTGHALDDVEKVEGGAALRIEDPASRSQPLARQITAVIPDKTYELSFWSHSAGEACSVSFAFEVAVEGADMEPLARCTIPSDQEWRQYSYSFTAPSSCQSVQLRLVADGGGGHMCKSMTWLDEVTLREAIPSLLANGSFEYGENGSAYWIGELAGGVTVSADSATAVEGHRALRVDLADNMNFGLRQTVDVVPGKQYRLEGWIRTENVGGFGACLEVQDADRGFQAYAKSTTRITGTHGWQKVSLDVTVPVETKAIAVFVRRPGAAGAGAGTGTVWFDACHFAPIEADQQ